MLNYNHEAVMQQVNTVGRRKAHWDDLIHELIASMIEDIGPMNAADVWRNGSRLLTTLHSEIDSERVTTARAKWRQKYHMRKAKQQGDNHGS